MGPYCRARAPCEATVPQISWNASSPKVSVSGNPLVSEIRPGRERVDMRSQVEELFISFTRLA